ncbi:structure-specific endonuclease subunit slx1 isoform X1 [Centruroides vittatus]|uniref:structure-specific endonuclease subunit slx1 isoform X1 n=1 Tax=Centruroides vittatus TaxID=120091 RepID=UPI0035109384
MEEVEDFHGCYLLRSTNPKYTGKTYVGYTVDPDRRIRRHNAGLKSGGAWRTDGRGPWDMILVIHGFPNTVSALRFEWAWQHPQKSRRLQHVTKKQKNETSVAYHIRILLEMLRVGPWNRLPLTIRKLNENYELNIPIDCSPPFHMPITSGSVKCRRIPKDEILNMEAKDSSSCSICCSLFQMHDRKLRCLVPECRLLFHVICLSKCFLGSSKNLLPVSGFCPNCNQELLWGDVIRFSRGCYKYLKNNY